ncbi:hypothetical protein B0H14DRAFT_2589494 [Mycena olivaceomarginata]|nr:hypothetical protein B0H14DRAFT_2589494 [Mycena olivaceomarginata]
MSAVNSVPLEILNRILDLAGTIPEEFVYNVAATYRVPWKHLLYRMVFLYTKKTSRGALNSYPTGSQTLQIYQNVGPGHGLGRQTERQLVEEISKCVHFHWTKLEVFWAAIPDFPARHEHLTKALADSPLLDTEVFWAAIPDFPARHEHLIKAFADSPLLDTVKRCTSYMTRNS